MNKRTPTNFILGKYVKDAQGDLWKISAVLKDSVVVVCERDGEAICNHPLKLHERKRYSSHTEALL